ncbi:hypothetical protein [Fusobacterium perfoetens]|jgi:hypothetical protein|uniref:hypothetical protein n=1 Tax=Fusobacterium perfoetens TaxID=852 RepID=UPI0015A60AA6|nr:hypothetical protein [Fusobacterium perfoetens]MCF2613202.1 hypothetical protein [Fusobacterium perfoetens]
MELNINNVLDKNLEIIKKVIIDELTEEGYICDSDNDDNFVNSLMDVQLQIFGEALRCTEEEFRNYIRNNVEEFMMNFKKLEYTDKDGVHQRYYHVADRDFDTKEELEDYFKIEE